MSDIDDVIFGPRDRPSASERERPSTLRKVTGVLLALVGVALAGVGVIVLVRAIGDRNEDGTALVGVVALILCFVFVVSGVSLLRGGRFGSWTTPGNQHYSSDIPFLGGD